MIVIQPRDPPGDPVSFTGAFMIGSRAPGGAARPAELQLAGDDVSVLHAAVRPTAVGWVITDLRTAAGTSVNGIPVSFSVPVVLHRGDRIRIGSAELVAVPDPP